MLRDARPFISQNPCEPKNQKRIHPCRSQIKVRCLEDETSQPRTKPLSVTAQLFLGLLTDEVDEVESVKCFNPIQAVCTCSSHFPVDTPVKTAQHSSYLNDLAAIIDQLIPSASATASNADPLFVGETSPNSLRSRGVLLGVFYNPNRLWMVG